MRDRYPHWDAIQSRWRDNDTYGHLNNVVYYEYFDSVINRYLIAHGGLDIENGTTIGVAASSSCEFHSPLAFPAAIDAGLAVTHLGGTSVHYEIGLFARDANEPSATGTFVHVFVDRATRRPTPIPIPIRDALARLVVS